MTPEEFSHIREIFEKAILLGEGEQRVFLERQTEGRPEIRSEVEKLLRGRKRIPSWLDQPVIGSSVSPAQLEAPDITGRRLSGYTLLREIGRGGMGHVYLAERSDGAFRKQAAIKLVLPSAHMGSITARFQHEREILASLDHPNIARLLDGGITEEGWPYFVMEYVEGQPVDRWCDERKLSVTQRIALFRDVLAAVRYAHQHLVVHRDLKPGNIFVTRDGAVKLLDFGIAKVLSSDGSGLPADTVTLAQVMTPEYASPEQVNGEPITTLTDVYSLGVILYELLTGHRPYRLLSAAMHEMARVIAEVEPSRPSYVVSTTESGSGRSQGPITPDSVSAVREGDPARLRKRLSGDLDAILLMALRKEPERRYSSAESLAKDLERHLQNRPIAAREATPWYRLKRFCMRNPGAVAAGVLLAISFLGSGAAIVMQARHDIQAAIENPAHRVFLAPFLLFSLTINVVVFAALVYLFGPNRTKLIGAVVGGSVWSVSLLCRSWLERDLGWWHSRVGGTADPLLLLTPFSFLIYLVLTSVLLLILSAIGHRYTWKGQALTLLILSLYGASRERTWYGIIVPALSFQSGTTALLGSAAMLAASGAIGLFTMQSFRGPSIGYYDPREE
jgi:serine/threonine protein kinase